MIRRVHRKIERTSEELAELKATRERFQCERPGIDDLVEQGYEGPVLHGDIIAFLSTIAKLKRERENRGLTLADVAERSGLDEGMLSRLENGKILNPTVSTLWRYATAVNCLITMDVGSLFPEDEKQDQEPASSGPAKQVAASKMTAAGMGFALPPKDTAQVKGGKIVGPSNRSPVTPDRTKE